MLLLQPPPLAAASSHLCLSPLHLPHVPNGKTKHLDYPLYPRRKQAFRKGGREILLNANVSWKIRGDRRQNTLVSARKHGVPLGKSTISPRQSLELKYGSLPAQMVSAGHDYDL